MLSWRTELEHTEIRAEAALVTILSLTQVTELKLLIDTGPNSHRFYTLIMSLLVATILLEALVGAIVIYIGGIHRSKPPKSTSTHSEFDDDDYDYNGLLMTSRRRLSWRHNDNQSWCCCLWRCRNKGRSAAFKNYKMQDALLTSGGSGAAQELLQPPPATRGHSDNDDSASITCCPQLWNQNAEHVPPNRTEAQVSATASASPAIPIGGVGIKMSRLSSTYTVQQSSAVRLVDLDYQLTRVRSRVDSLESAVKRGTATSGELEAARREMTAIARMRDDAETNRQLAEMRHRRDAIAVDLEVSQRQAALFVRVAYWQNTISYLVYAILLLNVIITTFGMSGDKGIPAVHFNRSFIP